MGGLYVEDPCLGSEYMELGRDLSLPYGLDPRRVALGGDWDFVNSGPGRCGRAHRPERQAAGDAATSGGPPPAGDADVAGV